MLNVAKFSCFITYRFSSDPINLAPSVPTVTDKSQPYDFLHEMRSEDRSYDPPPTLVGLDDTHRPSMDSFAVSDQPLPPSSPVMTSYDELRRKNREQYEQKRMDTPKRTETGRSAPLPAQPSYVPPSAPSSAYGQAHPKKNAYGDVWED